MTEKAKGGRGKKATDPYQRLSVTVPPRLREWVDGEAQRRGVTRSEVVSQVLKAAQAAATPTTRATNGGPILKHRGKGRRR